MLRLSRRQRAVLIEKVPDIANIVLGSLALGQFLTQQPFSSVLAVVGVVAWIGFWGIALALARREDK